MRRFTKLSLRALFVFVTLCCLAAGWVAMEMRRFREQATVLKGLELRLGSDFYRVRTIPAWPQWFWKPLVGEDAVEVEYASLAKRWPPDAKAVGPTEEEARIIAKWTKVKGLTLGGDGITDELMASFRHMPDLTRVRLLDTSVTSRGIAQIRGLNHVTETKVELTQGWPTEGKDIGIRADAIEALASLPNLNDLTFDGYHLDEAAANALPKLKNVGKLMLVRGDLSDVDVASIAQMPKLTNLIVYTNRRISDASIDALGRLKNLTELRLQQTGVTVEGLERLVQALPQFDPALPVQDDLYVDEPLERELMKRRAARDRDESSPQQSEQ
ncbi:MAG: hypothetical protein U0836_16860 [Pirellulales bacterium]